MSTPSTSPARSDRTVERTNPEDLIREIKLLGVQIQRCHRAIAMWREKIAGLVDDAAPLPAMGEFLKNHDCWVDELTWLEMRKETYLDHYNFCVTTFDGFN